MRTRASTVCSIHGCPDIATYRGRCAEHQRKRPSRGSGHRRAKTRKRILKRDGHRCTHIEKDGTRCAATTDLHIDHHIPFSLGGSDDDTNLRVLCSTHNLIKGAKWPDEPETP